MTRRLSDADFSALKTWLERQAGLVFDDSRRASLAAVVSERLLATRREGVLDYIAYVGASDGAAERQALLDAVTIQETHFHRNRPQLEALRRQLLPALIKRAADEGRQLNVWSAGCSTGEEPYTLAMLALEVAAGLALPPSVTIVGTDVSASALQTASEATYAGRTIELAEAGALQRWFQPSGDGRWTVNDEVREHVDLRLHNLVTDAPPFGVGEVDLVVCRNVTIYFSRDTTRDLVGRFHAQLRPGGWLVLGHAETLWQVSDDFLLVPVGEAFAYRKQASPEPATVAKTAEPRRVRLGRLRPSGAGRRARSVPESPASIAAPVVARTPRADGRVLVAQARQLMAVGSYDDAARVAEVATTVAPLHAPAYVVLGQARSTLGDDASAVEPFRKAVYLDPSLGHAHFLLAGVLMRLGDAPSASRSFRSAAETLPGVAVDELDTLLDGRPVEELVALCLRLADDGTGLAVSGT